MAESDTVRPKPIRCDWLDVANLVKHAPLALPGESFEYARRLVFKLG